MSKFVYALVATLALGTVYAGEQSKPVAKPQAAATVKTDKKAADCNCATVEVARKATLSERRAFSRNLVVVEPVKVVEVKKVEVKAASSCDCCDSCNAVATAPRRAVRRVRGVVDGLLCR